jgi:peptidoglycan/xylan/chitin deacetylase (PgdA/CDA1 family)
MLKWLVRGGVAIACLTSLAWGGLRLSTSRTYQMAGDLLNRVETSDSVVALTFDDGPTAIHTDSVLAVLAAYGVPATFFMVGQQMERNPEVVARVRAAGHELANHTYTHRRMVLKMPGTFRWEVERTDSLIRATGQQGEIMVRPPYGRRLLGLPLYLARDDRPVVLWNLEPDTYHSQADGVVDYVLERVRPGSIIQLHVEIPGRRQNRAALPRILSEVQARGYRFVTLAELRAHGTQP